MTAIAAAPPHAPPQDAIHVDGVEHVYRSGTRALQPVDLRIAAGEFVSIIGPSGCGKSTLLRIVAGLEAPTRGTVRHAGGAGPARDIAFVFQQPTLMPWTDVRRNVRLPLDLAGAERSEADRRVAAALAQVGLEEFASALPRELSGGMQMRVSIARALVTDPALLLLDEPFGALDEITRGRLDDALLSVWSARRLTALFVTHSIHEAVYLSTRVLVMSARPGRIAAEIAIDEPFPRTDAYRVSERCARQCEAISRLLLAGGAA